MATVQKNNIVLKKTPPEMYPILTDGTSDINGGDLVYFDTSAKVVKSATSDGNCATLAGVAENGSFIQPYSAKKYFDRIPVVAKGIVKMQTTTSETYNEGTAVYFGADAQTITTVAGTNIIGYVKMGPGQTSVTGGAGVEVQVDLAVKFPTTAFA